MKHLLYRQGSKKKLLFAFFVGLSLVIFLGSCSNEINNRSEVEESAAVYSVVIRRKFVSYSGQTLLISNRSTDVTSPMYSAFFGADYIKNTSFGQRVRFLQENYPSVDVKTLESFQGKFEQSYTFGAELNLTSAGPFSIQRTDENAGSDSSGRSHDLLMLTRIGFSPSKTQAFVGVDFYCDALCGFGDYILLEKEAGEWKIQKIFMGWRS